jgi:hypothetical protein
MNTPPFASNYGTNTTVQSATIASFITGASTSPTPDTGSYARWQKVGTIVNLEFKYKFLTIGSGAMSINLPVPINSNYPKPQSVCHIRYFNSPGTGKVFIGHYNENTVNSVNIVISTTYGGVPASMTTSSPETLVIGDILTGVIIYETS